MFSWGPWIIHFFVTVSNTTSISPLFNSMSLQLLAVCQQSRVLLVEDFPSLLCVNYRSGGQWGDGPRGLPFPPPPPLLSGSHYTLLSQISNLPAEPVAVSPDSQCCTQECKNTHTHTITSPPHKLLRILTTMPLFFSWWPVAFPIFTTAPNTQEVCIQLTTTKHQDLWGVFIGLYMGCQSVCTSLAAQGKVNNSGGHSLIWNAWPDMCRARLPVTTHNQWYHQGCERESRRKVFLLVMPVSVYLLFFLSAFVILWASVSLNWHPPQAQSIRSNQNKVYK